MVLLLGLWGKSAVALLVGVPGIWATTGFVVSDGAAPRQLAWVGAIATGVYLGAALRWLRGAPERRALDWTKRAPAQGAAGFDSMPFVGAALVAGPALGVVLWPAIPRAAAAGFPGHAGQVTVGLALLGTLVGLALATDLARGRAPLIGSPSRARVYAVVAALALGAWVAVKMKS